MREARVDAYGRTPDDPGCRFTLSPSLGIPESNVLWSTRLESIPRSARRYAPSPRSIDSRQEGEASPETIGQLSAAIRWAERDKVTLKFALFAGEAGRLMLVSNSGRRRYEQQEVRRGCPVRIDEHTLTSHRFDSAWMERFSQRPIARARRTSSASMRSRAAATAPLGWASRVARPDQLAQLSPSADGLSQG